MQYWKRLQRSKSGVAQKCAVHTVQAGRQAGRKAGRHADEHAGGHASRQAGRQAGRQGKHAGNHTRTQARKPSTPSSYTAADLHTNSTPRARKAPSSEFPRTDELPRALPPLALHPECHAPPPPPPPIHTHTSPPAPFSSPHLVQDHAVARAREDGHCAEVGTPLDVDHAVLGRAKADLVGWLVGWLTVDWLVG